MAKKIEIAKIDELVDGTMKSININGHAILLARVDNKYYATGNRCPHMGGNLSRGKLEGTIVTCPVHGSRFDLKDGRVVRWLAKSGLLESISTKFKPPKPLIIYNVKIESDKILVEI